jgi:biotin carboxyl carrier protein
MIKWQIIVDGHTVEIDPQQLELVKEVEPSVYSVLLDGRSFEVRAVAAPPVLNMEARGRRFGVEVRDPRNASRRSRAAVASGRQNVAAPMPGKVVRLLVREGDAVDVGQGLIVVEAMKMQNEMKASRAGRVAEVRVREGDTVAAGDKLVVLE